MTEFYDPQHEGLPFFSNEMTGAQWGNGHHESFSMAHVPGRWLNALLNARDVLGDAPVPQKCLDTLARWAYRAMEATEMGVPACTNLSTMQPEKRVDLHNLREQMHALYALWRFRGDARAFVLALRLIDTVDRYFVDANGGWDEQRFRAETGGSVLRWEGLNPEYPFPVTFGRYIGPLVKFYKASGEPKALAQAIRLKNTCLDRVFLPSGAYDPWVFGNHTHSTTATMSSLAQLYEVTREQRLLEAILAFMDNGLKQMALDVGWCIENDSRVDEVGEVNNTSDIMETCLILGRCGIAGAYARAERILRGHMLPSQLLDTSFLPDDEDPAHVTRYHMRQRAQGAFGFPCPFGHEDHPGASISFNWDIVGGAVGGLCEAMRHCVSSSEGLLSVNLLFDCDTDALSFQSPYGRDDTAEIQLHKQVGMLRVRLPGHTSGWRTDASAAFADGEWLYLGAPTAGQPIHIHFDFETCGEIWRFRGAQHSVTWRGEELCACRSEGKRLCFFPERTV